MQNVITGGCLCGKVRYEVAEKPVFAGNCHCHDCQKASGGAYSPEMFFAKSVVRISGELKSYETIGDSGKPVWREFCPNCGTWVFSKAAIIADLVGVRAGTLDDTTNYQPEFDMYTDSAAHWDVMNPSLQKFAKAAS